MSSFTDISILTSSYSSASMSWASSITRTVLVILAISTFLVLIRSTACFTILSDLSRFPIWPRRSKQYEWNVFISTNAAALPISSYSLVLNSVAAALENVSISSCSCFTSSIISSDASLCTRTFVLPLPGPAATTIILLLLSFIIFNCAGDNVPKISLNLAGVIFCDISVFLPLKYFSRKKG